MKTQQFKWLTNTLLAFCALVGMTGTASATEQCFHEAGTYGNLTVVRTGACGNTLNYGGLNGLWMGNSNAPTTSCTYTLTANNSGVLASTIKVNMTAHSNDQASYREETIISLDGTPFNVITADIDNTTFGGVDLTALANGRVSSVGGDGRGTINLTRATGLTTTITLEHLTVLGGPNGTIYQICADDNPYATPTVTAQLTNTNTPTIAGTYDPTSTTVEVTVGNTVYTTVNGLALDPLNGTWSVDLMATGQSLAEGPHDIIISTSNANNNATDNTTDEINVDTIAPVVAITAPTDGTLTSDNTPTINGTTEPGTTPSVIITDAQGGPVETQNPSPDAQGNWTFDATTLPDGTYTINAEVSDAAGNVGTNGPITFTVDTTPPAITLDTLADGTLTNDNTPSFSGTTEPGAVVEVLISDAQGAVQLQTATVDAQGNWTVDTTTLPDGNYSATAIATDAAGNFTTSSANNFEIDATAPPINVTAPVDGTLTNNNIATITGDTEPGAAVEVAVFDAQNNPVASLTPMVDAAGNWTIDTGMLADGTYTIAASATDLAGNTSVSTPITITIDTTPPAVTLVTPAEGLVTNDETPTYAGTTEPNTAISVIILDANGTTIETLTTTSDAAGNWTVDGTIALGEGTFSARATATDAAGNSAPSNTNAFTVDLTAPVVAITSPVDNSTTNDNTPTVSGTTEADATVSVDILDAQNMVVETATATVDAQGNWTVDTSMLADGTYTAVATATDVAGNSTNTIPVTFTVDTTPPAITLDTPADDSTTNDNTPTVSGTTESGLIVTVTVTDAQGTPTTFMATADMAGNWTVDTTELADGEYTFTASVSDTAGNTGSASNAATIDTLGPETTIVTPAMDMLSSINQPEITGTTEPGATVNVDVKDDTGTSSFTGTVTADDQGNWTITPDMPLDDNTYTVTATGTDTVGNEGTPATTNFTVDTNAPVITITAPTNGDTTTNATPTVTGTAEPGATIDVLVDGTSIGTATADAAGNWSIDLVDALDAGDHTIEAKSTDDAGNEGSSGEITITVEAPKDPVVITSPTEGDDVTGPDVTVTGTGTPGEEVTVTIGGKTQTAVVDDNGNWTTTFTEVPAGEQTISAKGDGDLTTINVNIVDPITDTLSFVTTGGACSSTNASPTSSLWLLGMVGLLALRRRKRKA